MPKTSSSAKSSILARRAWAIVCASLCGVLVAAVSAQPPSRPQTPKGPWMDKTLSADQRADMVIEQMTLDEKISMLHGARRLSGRGRHLQRRRRRDPGHPAGWGCPPIQLADSAVGVRAAAERGRYATLLPSTIAEAATWDPKLAYEYGEVIGRELRDQQYNVSLGGGVNLMREPRNGRNFEYLGEDPILAGKMVAQLIKGLQSQKVIGDIKHYAFNDQETGRNIGNVMLEQARHARDGPAGVRDRRPRRPARHGDVLLQQGQRRLGLREQLPAERRAEEGLGLQGLCAFGLGRDAQHRQGRAGRPRQRAARAPCRTGAFRRRPEEGGGERRGSDGAAQRHGAPHRAHRVRGGHRRRSAARPRGGSVQGADTRAGDRRAGLGAAEEREQPASADAATREVDRADRLARRYGRAFGRRSAQVDPPGGGAQPVRRSRGLVPALAPEGHPREGAEGQGGVQRRRRTCRRRRPWRRLPRSPSCSSTSRPAKAATCPR